MAFAQYFLEQHLENHAGYILPFCRAKDAGRLASTALWLFHTSRQHLRERRRSIKQLRAKSQYLGEGIGHMLRDTVFYSEGAQRAHTVAISLQLRMWESVLWQEIRKLRAERSEVDSALNKHK